MTKLKRCFRLACAVLSFGLTCGLGAENATNEISAAHRAALDQFRTECVAAWLSGDSKGASAHDAENVRLMPAFQATVLGRSHAAAYREAFLRRFQVRVFQCQAMGYLDLGQQVAEFGGFTQKRVLKSTGKERDAIGKYVNLWAKGSDGRLTLLTAAWNYDHGIEFADELRFSEVPAVKMALEAHVPVKGGVSFELAALSKLHETAIVQHDGSVWAQFFADDAVLMSQFAPVRRGRQEIDRYIATHASELPVFEKLDIRNDRIDDLGQYVVEYAAHIANWRNGDASGVNTGKDLRIWRRNPNGALRLLWQIAMYD